MPRLLRPHLTGPERRAMQTLAAEAVLPTGDMARLCGLAATTIRKIELQQHVRAPNEAETELSAAIEHLTLAIRRVRAASEHRRVPQLRSRAPSAAGRP